jgi:two-component system, NtrC family, response regulator AtoC
LKNQGTVLIVEDEPNMQRVLRGLLERDGYRTLSAADGKALDEAPVDAVLTDFKMPRVNGLELLDAIRRRHIVVPVILLTGHGSIGGAVEALKHGAFDYLTKPFDPAEIQHVIAKAVRTHALQASDPSIDGDPEPLLIGASAGMREVQRMIERVASTPATVLITGESGTGKELVARALHMRSPRAAKPFVKINCAAIPEGLLESELFGHEKGAFTGAAHRKQGRFELAHEGTLFLDEIGELPAAAQPKLLRALQDGCFYHVGGTQPVHVDVRLVAATNRDLERAVREGGFREDLFYRINVVRVRLPSLRERSEDIPALAQRFVERFSRRHARAIEAMEPDALDLLCAHSWPGNIRELENTVERGVLLADGPRIRSVDLPPELLQGARAGCAEPGTASGALRGRVRSETRRIEREAIVEALIQTEGNVTRAALRLGLSRRGLQLKMKELEIERGEPPHGS